MEKLYEECQRIEAEADADIEGFNRVLEDLEAVDGLDIALLEDEGVPDFFAADFGTSENDGQDRPKKPVLYSIIYNIEKTVKEFVFALPVALHYLGIYRASDYALNNTPHRSPNKIKKTLGSIVLAGTMALGMYSVQDTKTQNDENAVAHAEGEYAAAQIKKKSIEILAEADAEKYKILEKALNPKTPAERKEVRQLFNNLVKYIDLRERSGDVVWMLDGEKPISTYRPK
ncbi:hypothetical protein GOV03_04485 [Candidatus Woesearchaeota archaeon]|nr:hypothetical protein [Candidatus Woesearchaeota archaeon]